ncbi:UNVERIFIED_CONTAM: Large extracellular alpha-helical protein [Acetivibrio alkalicellulosi]
MKKKILKYVLFISGVIFALSLLINLIYYISISNLEITITTQEKYISGAPGSCQIFVLNSKKSEPVKSKVSINLLNENKKRVKEVFQGYTDDLGQLAVNFNILEDLSGEYYLDFRVSSNTNRDRILKKIVINHMSSTNNMNITLDKPLYRPGDELNFRVLVTDSRNDHPLQTDVDVTITDAKQNTVYKKTLPSSEYGILSGNFLVGDKVNSGTYTITADFDSSSLQRDFQVTPYILPKFNVTIKTDSTEYLLNEQVTGTIDATYFFGQPVSNANVKLKVNNDVITQLLLDEYGKGDFSFKINTEGQNIITAEVIDNSNYLVTDEITIYSSMSKIIAKIIPENNSLIPGIENEAYVFTTKIDGSPLKAYIRLAGDINREIVTDQNGIAKFSFIPVNLNNDYYTIDAIIYYEDHDQIVHEQYINFKIPYDSSREMILRTDKGVYSQNETISLDIVSNTFNIPTRVFISKNNQIINTFITDNSRIEIELPQDIYGLINMYAEKQTNPAGLFNPDRNNRIIRSQKTIFINPEKNMTVDIIKENRAFKPGEDIEISFDIRDSNNNPLNSAIGLSILDEAILTLANYDMAIDNIKNALSSDNKDYHMFYEAILSNASQSTLKALLLEESLSRPKIDQLSHNNFTQKQNTLNRFWWMLAIIIIFIIVYLLILFKPFRMFIFFYAGYLAIFILVSFLLDLYYSNTHINFGIIELMLLLIIPSTLIYVLLLNLLSKYFKTYYSIPNITGISAAITFCILLIILIPNYNLNNKYFDSMFSMESGTSSARPNTTLGSNFSPGELHDSASPSDTNSFGSVSPSVTNSFDSEALSSDSDNSKTLRSNFLESVYFAPQIIAQDGKATFKIPLADNITTWKVMAAANSINGYLGSNTENILVFQDFFIDFELPRNLKAGDELKMPLTVFNYTDSSKEVTLTIKEDQWFTLIDGQSEINVIVPPNGQKFLYVPIKINSFGNFSLRVDAQSDSMSDAVKKSVKVSPQGLCIDEVASSGSIKERINQDVFFLSNAIDDTKKIRVNLYTSNMSHVVGGLEGVLRLPNGCFEQISSSLYPNILVLKYLKDTNTSSLDIEKVAYDYIEKGFQKILTYEVNGEKGGFSLYGHRPAETVLTAYGLMQFNDLKKVHYVDDDLINRMKEFLFGKQKQDGSFEITGRSHSINSYDNFSHNAYIAWALSEVCKDDSRFDRTITYLKNGLDKVDDNYTLALIANILVNTGDKMADTVINQLINNIHRENTYTYLKSNRRDYYGSYGKIQSLQTTALASIALSKSGLHPDINQQFISYIISNKDPYGAFSTTQATILCLKALIESINPVKEDFTVTIQVNDEKKQIDIKSGEVLDLYQLEFDTIKNENIVMINTSYPISYDIIKEYYIPYDMIKSTDHFEISRRFNTNLKVNEEVTNNIMIINRKNDTVQNLMVIVDVPQGFTVDDYSLKSLVEKGVIEEYSLSYGRIDIYIRDFQPNELKSLDILMRPGYPVNVNSSAVRVYDYYNPFVETILPPININVEM